MSSPKHIIKRQVIEVDVPSVEEAWQIQNRFSELYKYELMQILEEVFSDLTAPDELLRIDKLELDLGKIKANSFNEEVGTKLRTLLYEKITEIKQKIISQESGFSSEETVKTVKTVKYTGADFLVHFLKTGTAPWWYSKQNSGTLDKIVGELIANRPQWIRSCLRPMLSENEIRSRLISHLEDKRLTEFLQVLDAGFIPDVPRVAELITDQIRKVKTTNGIHASKFRVLFWNSLVKKIANGKEDLLVELFSRNEVVKIVRLLMRKEKSVKEFVLVLELEEIIGAGEKMNKHISKKTAKEINRNFMYENEVNENEFTNKNQDDAERENGVVNRDNKLPEVKNENERTSETEKPSPEEETEKTSVKKLRSKLRKLTDKKRLNNSTDENGIDNQDNSDSYNSVNLIPEESVGQIRKGREQNNSIEQDEVSSIKNKVSNEGNDQEEFKIYSVNEEDLSDFTIENAGLVLLWPYLNPFFTELGLVAEKKFIDESASSRAVHLLHYLATGVGSGYEEHELVLNKLLCGLDVTAAIDMEFEITPVEKKEAESLLQAVINNWKAIGSTSVNGFRGTFILREGALKKDEQGWRLYIDRKAFDILLDRLPWGISIIRLPWNVETMYVEW